VSLNEMNEEAIDERDLSSPANSAAIVSRVPLHAASLFSGFIEHFHDQRPQLANSVMAKLYDVLTNGDDDAPASDNNFFS
jgi:hypothetical protein